MTQPNSGASTPDKDDSGQQQPRAQVQPYPRRPMIPISSEVFNSSAMQLAEVNTPGRLYTSSGTRQEQPAGSDTIVDSGHPPSTAGRSRASGTIQYNTVGAEVVREPQSLRASHEAAIKSGNVQIPGTPSYRPAAGSPDRMHSAGRPTLVPNFHPVSPSIFNIDLHKTATKGEPGDGIDRSPLQLQGQQAQDSIIHEEALSKNRRENHSQIYVSINQSKRKDADVGGQGSKRGAGASATDYSQGTRVRRIGQLQNKGDKIKFGVLISRDAKKQQQRRSIDKLDPHEILETPKQLLKQGRIAIGKHSDAVNNVISQYPTYTTTKTLPTVLVNQHVSRIKQFKKNFMRETDAFSRHSYSMASRAGPAQSTTVGGGGYYTDTESLGTRAHDLRKDPLLTATRKSKKSFWSDDQNLMSIRDVIEEHARSVVAVKKSFRPNVHFEIDERRRKRNREIEDRGRKIARDLNLSPHSCCTRAARFYRSLTDEQPVRLHNRPLSHMMRPNQRLIAERKQYDAEEKQRLLEAEKFKLKSNTMRISLNNVLSDLKGGMATGQRGTQLSKELNEAVEDEQERHRRRIIGHRSKDAWEQERKDIEQSIDRGMTFSHLSRQYPMKKEWAKYLVLLKAKEKDRRDKEQKISEILEDLDEQGINDPKQVAYQLDIFEYQELKKRAEKSKARLGAKAEAKYYRPVDTDRTLKVEPISMDLSDDYDDGPGDFKPEDFEGVETFFSNQSLEQRKLRVDRARERLREKHIQKLAQLEDQKIREDFEKANKPMAFCAPAGLSQTGRGKGVEEKSIPIQQQRVGSYTQRRPKQTKKILQDKSYTQKLQIESTARDGLEKFIIDNQQHQSSEAKAHQDSQAKPAKRVNREGKPPTGLPIKKLAKKEQHDYLDQNLPLQSAKVKKNMNIQNQNYRPRTGKLSPSSYKESEKMNQTLRSATDTKDKAGQEEIRVVIASGSFTALQKVEQTIKSSSHMRDYSLEDGVGIFEKKTLQNENSVEERRMLMDSSVTQGSIDRIETILKQHETSSEDIIRSDVPRSQTQHIKQIMMLRTKDKNQDGVKIHAQHGEHSTQILDKEDGKSLVISPQTTEAAQVTVSDDRKIDNFIQQPPRISRPSNTLTRFMLNRRRQPISSQYKKDSAKKSPSPSEQKVLMLPSEKKQRTETQKSDGKITKAQKQSGQKKPVAQTAQPSRLDTAKKGAAKSIAKTQVAHISRQVTDAGSIGQTSLNLVGTGITMARKVPMEHWRSESKKIIWKEILKVKEEQKLDPTARVSRHLIKTIRNNIRRMRRRHARRKGRVNQVEQKSSQTFSWFNNKRQSSLSMVGDAGRQKSARKSNEDNVACQEAAKGGRKQMIQGNAMIAPRGNRLQQNFVGVSHYDQQHGTGQLRTNLSQINNNQQQILNDRTQKRGSMANEALQSGGSTTGYDYTDGKTTTRDGRGSNLQISGTQRTSTGEIDLRSTKEQIELGTVPAILANQEVSFMSFVDQNDHHRKNFIEFNRACVRENSLRKRLGSNMSRLTKMRGHRKVDSKYQQRLNDNMNRLAVSYNQKSSLGLRKCSLRQPLSIQRLKTQAQNQNTAATYANIQNSTAKLYTSFKDQITDKRSMQVFRKNDLNVDPEIDNQFSRQQTWNQTLNCPYFGLMQLRTTQDKPINSDTRAENILIPFTTGNKQDRKHIRRVKSAIHHHNKLREMDKRVYTLIEACQESQKIQWKPIYDKNEEFRNSQRKKMNDGEPQQLSIDDLMELMNV